MFLRDFSHCRRRPVRLLPREEEFFDLFVAVANRNKEAAQHLRELFDAPPERRTPHVEAIKRLEHEADQVTHEVVNRLDRTFITPLDREDIHQLASDLDDVMDAMDGTARRAQIFRLGVAPQGVLRLVDVLERMMGVLLEAVSRLKKGDDVMKYCVEAKQYFMTSSPFFRRLTASSRTPIMRSSTSTSRSTPWGATPRRKICARRPVPSIASMTSSRSEAS